MSYKGEIWSWPSIVLNSVFPFYLSYCKHLTKLVHDFKTVQLHNTLETLANVAIKITTQDQNYKENDIDKLLLMLSSGYIMV